MYINDGHVYGRLGLGRSDELVFAPSAPGDDEAKVQTTILQHGRFSRCRIQVILGAPPRDAISRPLSDFWDDACPGPALHPYLKYWKYPDRDRLESAALGGDVLRVSGTAHHAKQIRACMAKQSREARVVNVTSSTAAQRVYIGSRKVGFVPSEGGRRRAGPCDLISLETYVAKDGTDGFTIKIRAPRQR